MKNKLLYLSLLILTSLVFASCAGSRYGCPASTASAKTPVIEKHKI
jgi:hypothetical protein